jgi:hypothetical protein
MSIKLKVLEHFQTGKLRYLEMVDWEPLEFKEQLGHLEAQQEPRVQQGRELKAVQAQLALLAQMVRQD